MHVHPHVLFDGRCEEAFKYYEQHLGGKITRLGTYEGTPLEKQMPEMRSKVIHAQVQIGGTALTGADAPAGRYQAAQGLSVTLYADTPADAERMFHALADGGNVQMAMDKTFFAAKFGVLRDRFGVPRMVICEKAG